MNNRQLPSWLYYIFFLLSYSPLSRVTYDNNFGEVKRFYTDPLRISVFSINIGKRIFYFLSWTLERPTKYKWFYSIEFDKLKDNKLPDEADVNQKVTAFKESLDNKTDEDLIAFANALSFRINQEDQRKVKSFNKFLAYIAIIAFILPLFAPYLINLWKISQLNGLEKSIYVIFTFLLLYNFINLVVFLYEMINVKGYNRYGIRQIRQASNHKKEFLVGQYHDWYWIKEESRYEVSVIKNVEKYIIFFAIWTAILLVSQNTIQYLDNKDTSSAIVLKQNEIINIDLMQDEQEIFKQNNKLFSQLQKDLLDNRIKSIILVNDSKQQLAVNKYRRILMLINTYNINKIDTIEIDNNVNQLGKANLQLIIIRR